MTLNYDIFQNLKLPLCVNLRPRSPQGQWEPKVLRVPAGEAEKDTGWE